MILHTIYNLEIDNSFDIKKWNHLIENENVLIKEYIHIIDRLTDYFKEIKKELIPSLLIFFLQNKKSEIEILNCFCLFNQIILHFNYFNDKYTDRRKNELLTNFFFNLETNENKFFLLNYKTYNKVLDFNNDDNDNIFYSNLDDKRRHIFLDENQYFNYIPFKCNMTHSEKEYENCPLAHNKYEIAYHPLFLKINKCSNGTLCENEFCYYFHFNKNDTRKNYNENNEYIKNLLDILTSLGNKSEIIKNNINDNIINIQKNSNLILPSEFDLDTYKTILCPLGKNCKLSTKLCFNYHIISERRRNPKNFKYSEIACEHARFNKKWQDPLGCNKVLLYLNFREIIANFHILYMNIYIIEKLINILIVCLKIKITFVNLF